MLSGPRGRAGALLRATSSAVAVPAGVCLLLVATFVVLGVPPGAGLRALWVGAAGNASTHLLALSDTVVEMSPLLLTGLGIVVAWSAGMFSIGGEGQVLMGALAATATGSVLRGAPPILITSAMVTAGVAGGAFWGWIAGALRTRRGVQEVISTIMLNYVAVAIVNWMVSGPLQEHSRVGPYSEPLPNSVLFGRLLPPSATGGMVARLHSGVLLSLLAAVVVWVVLYRTVGGFEMRVAGSNPAAAANACYPLRRIRELAMAASGALCGLAGAVELLGVSGRLTENFSPGWGYTAIPVALLGGLHPIGTLFSALFFGALTAGCGNLERTRGVSSAIILIVQASAVLAVVGLRAWRDGRAATVDP